MKNNIKNKLVTTVALLITMAMVVPATSQAGHKLTTQQKNQLKRTFRNFVQAQVRPTSQLGKRVYYNPPSIKLLPPQPVVRLIGERYGDRYGDRHCHPPVVRGTYSPRLKARFEVQRVFIPAFGRFTAIRIVSTPEWDSPLRELGLTNGDLITRLDGTRTVRLRELERHYGRTTVRYIKSGTDYVHDGAIHIRTHHNHGHGHHYGGGLAP